jgi:endonuclease YncB( thermonuclease family)
MSFPTKMLALAMAGGALLVTAATGAAKGKAADKWVEQQGVELLAERQADGDSFGMTVAGARNRLKRTYRLYGVDCPESDGKDKVLTQRIKEQAAHFGRKPEEIPGHGKDAAAFTEKLLKNGKPRVLTRGKMGQKVEKAPGRPQRYFALVEVTAPDGKRRWLHELLLEAGLARAYGFPAAWPPEEDDRHGEKEAEEKFMKELKKLENAAKRAGLGVWKKAG